MLLVYLSYLGWDHHFLIIIFRCTYKVFLYFSNSGRFLSQKSKKHVTVGTSLSRCAPIFCHDPLIETGFAGNGWFRYDQVTMLISNAFSFKYVKARSAKTVSVLNVTFSYLTYLLLGPLTER